MGIETVFQNAAVTAAAVFDGVFFNVVYTSKGLVTYDAVTDTNTSTDTQETVKFMFDSYTKQEVNNESILASDVKALIPQLNINAYPQIDDTIDKIENGVTIVYVVISIKIDPADALWELQIRRRN